MAFLDYNGLIRFKNKLMNLIDVYISNINSKLSAMDTATSSEVGMALKVKTVSNGHVTEWEFGATSDIDDNAGDGDMNKTWSADKLYSIEERVADLEYKPLTLNSLSVSPSIAEIGSTISSVSLSYAMNKDALRMQLDGSTISNTTATGIISLSNLSLITNKTWTLRAQDSRMAQTSQWVSRNVTLTFTNKVKYGAASIPAVLDDSFINGLQNQTLSTGKVRSFSVTAGQGKYIWYALPSSYGTCSFTVGGFTGGFRLISTQDHTNESGATVQYNIYRSDNPNLGTTLVTVS